MTLEIIAIYCWCELILRQLNILDDCRAEMNNSEVLTTAIVAVRFFSGNFENARKFLKEHKYIPNMLSKSRFNRRLHSLGLDLIGDVQRIIAELFKSINPTQEYAVDSFPVPVCENVRIFHSKIYNGEEYRGYQASKKRYFYGIKVHMIVTVDGKPIEFIFSPGSCSDIKAFKRMDLDLPEGSTIYGDKAYTDYEEEDFLVESGINLKAQRKENAKRQHSGCMNYLIDCKRKMVETAFSGIARLFPKHIHAVTKKGFELKVALFACVPSFIFLSEVVLP
jgi:Transposase DDE domain